MPGSKEWEESEDLSTEEGMRKFQERNFPKKCFFTQAPCNSLCKAYSVESRECKIVLLIDSFLNR